MEREGMPFQMATRSSCRPTAFQSASSRKGMRFFLRRLRRRAVRILLAATLLPLLPVSLIVEEAQAFEGTTDHSKVFEGLNVFGEPVVFVDDETARLASTLDESHISAYLDRPDISISMGAFMSTQPISLEHNWELAFDASVPALPMLSDYKFVNIDLIFGLQQSKDPRNTTTTAWWYHGVCRGGTTLESSICSDVFTNTVTSGRPANRTPLDWGSRTIQLSYDARTQTGTMTTGDASVSIANLRNKYGASAYLAFMGDIEWTGIGETLMPAPSDDMQVLAAFKSMSLPNLTPEMSNESKAFADHDIAVYRADRTTRIRPTDSVSQGEQVFIVVRTRNANSAASSGGYEERYDMHLRLSSATGIKPLVDAGHPVTVEVPGKPVASITDPSQAVESEEGVPLELVGYNKDTVISYWATVGAEGDAVDLTHDLIEDSFQGRQTVSVHLVDSVSLEPAPDGVDPDDPNSGAGTAFHYTRLPAANENGWNRTPVAVTFYAGDFDELLVTASDGGALGTLADREAWRRAADTDGMVVSLQAQSTAGALSKKGTEAIRIDTHVPTLSWNASAGTLTADDGVPPGSGNAMSGVWKIYRVKSDGRALDTDDVTKPPAVGASADGLSRGSVADDRLAMPCAEGQAAWDFDLTDGIGATVQTVASPAPGFYVAEDAAGNVSSVVEVREADEPTAPGPDGPEGPGGQDPTDPGGQNPTNPSGPETPGPPTVIVKPDPGRPGDTSKPLPPTKVEEDPAGKLSHAVIEDDLTVGTAQASPSAADFATLFAERYDVSSTLSDGALTYGPIRIFSADGQEVAAIDRTKPGDWVIEQRIVDSAGNSTTIRLSYHVREGVIDGWLGSGNAADGLGGAGGSSGGDGSDGAGTAAGEGKSRFASALRALPQTGGIFGSCPLHILFALIMVLASAYGMMRLRQESLDCKECYREAVR